MKIKFFIFVVGVYFLIAIFVQLGWLADAPAGERIVSYLSPSSEYWLGTDFLGRSILVRALQSTRVAVAVGLFATLISVALGTFLGTVAGSFRGWVDAMIVWLFTTLDSIPYILLLGSFAFALGQGLQNIFIALGLTSWTPLCRLVRTEFIKLQDAEFVIAAEAQGLNRWKIIFAHILPNVMHIILIQAGVIFVFSIKIEVILSYLGLGMEPGSASWGLMIDDAKQEISRGFWWNMIAATVFMFGLVYSVQILLEEWRKKRSPSSY